MMMACFNLLVLVVVGSYGKGIESNNGYMRCSFDHDCPDKMFCYEDSGHCSQCYDCSTYKRKASWRACARAPDNCGHCVAGYEEEIFHDGTVREMCVPSSATPPNSLSRPNDFYQGYMERYMWGSVATVLILVIAFSIFCKKSWKRVGLSAHQGLPGEQPPPYRSIELTTLTSNNSSVEMLAEEDHVLRVRQTKESPVQAVPFRQPDYIPPPYEFPDFENNNQDSLTDELDVYFNGIQHNSPIVELLDENTMPSDWTPQQNQEQMEVDEVDPDVDVEETCETSNHRQKTDTEAQMTNALLNINLMINNNITINKQ